LPEVANPECLVLDWLGGYWKLPKSDMDSGSGSLRECVVSMAKACGTAPVNPTELFEVFAALGDVVPRLYGSMRPSSGELAERYIPFPGLAAFLTARLAMATKDRRPDVARTMLGDADSMLEQLEKNPGKAKVQAFVHRARGVLELQQSTESYLRAEEHFQTALQLMPTNANALHLLGCRAIKVGNPYDAVWPLTQSLLLDPDYKGAYVNLGMAYLQLKNWERAIQVSQAGLERHPDSPHLAYHAGVAYSQQALALVNEFAEQSEEMEEARRVAQQVKTNKAGLEEAEKQARAEFEVKHAAWKQATEEKKQAQNEHEYQMKRVKARPIEEGMKLKVSQSCAVFHVFDSHWDEIGTLQKGQLVTVKGPPKDREGYTMVSIIETGGLVHLQDLEVCEVGGKGQHVVIEKEAALKVAYAQFEEARKSLNQAKERNKALVVEEAAIPRRPISRLLPTCEAQRYQELRRNAIDWLQSAQEHEISKNRRRGQPPFQEADCAMLDAMESGEGPVKIYLPERLGWPSAQYRL